MTSLELLQEIDAWLSFNNSPSKEQLKELRNDIKKHIAEQLSIHDDSDSAEYTRGYKDGWRDCCKDVKEFG